MKKKIGLLVFFAMIFTTVCVLMGSKVYAANKDGDVYIAKFVTDVYKANPLAAADSSRGGVLSKKHDEGYSFWVINNKKSHLAYCIGYKREMDGIGLPNIYSNDTILNGSGNEIPDEWFKQMNALFPFVESRQIKEVFEYTAIRDYVSGEKDLEGKIYGGQVLFWCTSEGHFDNPEKMNSLIESFCKGKTVALNFAKTAYARAYEAYHATTNDDTYIKEIFNKKYEMTWDEETKLFRYEINIDNFTFNKDNIITGSASSTNSNINVEIGEHSLVITSPVSIGSESAPATITINRLIGDHNGKIIYGQPKPWKDSIKNPQALAVCIAPTKTPDKYTFQVYTEAGNLKIEKKDNHGNYRADATFRVVGPFGERTVTTNAQGVYEFTNIPTGQYQVTEVTAPYQMNNDQEGQTVLVTVEPGKTVTYTRTNTYKRGSVEFYKRSSNGEVRGLSTLQGAKYQFCAAEDIYEGETKIYSKDEVIKGDITTDANGYGGKIENQPYGTYYFEEIDAPRGFNSSSDKVQVVINDENVTTTQVGTAINTPIIAGIKIEKTLENSDYIQAGTLAGVQFKLTAYKDDDHTSLDENQVYYTHGSDGGNVSTTDGLCLIDEIYYGDYLVEEVVYPKEAIPTDDFDIQVRQHGTTYEYNIEDLQKLMTIDVTKLYDEMVKGATDAKLSGAQFTIYPTQECTPGTEIGVFGPTDAKGYAISGTMPTNTYYIKETAFPDGMDKDALIPGENVTYGDKVYVIGGDVTEQTEHIHPFSMNMVNMAKLGKVSVIKYDEDNTGTKEVAAEGAKLRITLESTKGTAEEVFYTAVVDKYGRAEFVNDKVAGYSEYTIPFGKYILTEDEPSKDGKSYFYAIQNKEINIVLRNDSKYEIVADNPIDTYLKIVKKDAYTKERIVLPNATFKIWSMDTKAFVEQTIYPSGKVVDEFSSNENGDIILPDKLNAGEYIIYEIKAPEGYFLQPNYRLPENTADYGKKTEGCLYLNINNVALEVDEVEEFNPNKDITYTTTVEDDPLVVKLEIEKTGLVLTDTKEEVTKYGTLLTPIYTEKGLKDVKFNIVAEDNIVSADGKVTILTKGSIADTVVTNEDGLATSKELYPGKYKVVEVETLDGYIKAEDRVVELTNTNAYEKVKIEKVKINNDKQKFNLKLTKQYEEAEYTIGEDTKVATFAVYSNQAIKNYKGTTVINKGDLVGLITVEGAKTETKEVNLPEGTYIVEEVESSFPYSLATKTSEVILKGDKSNKDALTFDAGTFVNKEECENVTIIKLSTSDIAKEDERGFYGDSIEKRLLEETLIETYAQLKGMTDEEIKEFIEEKDWHLLNEVVYEIYADKECTKKVMKKADGKIATINITEKGIGVIERLPHGVYYLKEVVPPVMVINGEEINYEVAKEPVRIVVDDTSNMFVNVLADESPKAEISKLDIFTGDTVPNCTFVIKDKDGNIVYYLTTNELGIAYFPIDCLVQGEEYTYQEINAPAVYKKDGTLYELNTDEHKFVADFEIVDNEIRFKEKFHIENYRPYKKVTIVKEDDETGKPLQGCVFSVVLTDESGEPLVNQNGEYVYLVKEGVTDDNGEYAIDKAYYGTYKFIEVQAPEGYDLQAQNLEGYMFTVNDDSPEEIRFIVTNTGDIQVFVLAGVLLVSVIGIVTIAKKRKLN